MRASSASGAQHPPRFRCSVALFSSRSAPLNSPPRRTVGDACLQASKRSTSPREVSGKAMVSNSALASADTWLSMVSTASSSAEQLAIAARQRQ
eukprot:4318078-Pleurochrysis_carterae.AAC.1